MEVYVEYVLIENFAVDFTLFSLTRKFVKHKGGKVRAVFASVAGAVYATIAPLLSLTGVMAYILKFSFPVLACAFVFWEKGKWTKNLSKIGLSIAVFFALSFAYAGGLIAVFNFRAVFLE